MGWQDIKGAWNNFMQSPESRGGPTSMLDYGANKLADWAHRKTGGIPNTGVGNEFANARQRMTSNDAYRGTFPGSPYSPHRGFEEMQFSETEQVPQKKNIFSRFTTPMMALLKSQRNNPEENFGLDYYGSSLRDGRVNRNPAFNLHGDMNVASGFGAGLGAAGDKRIARIQETIANLPEQWSNLKESDEASYNAKLAAHQEKLKQFMIQNKKYKTALGGQGPKEEIIKDKITETITPPITHHTGGGNQGGGYRDQGGGYSTQGGFTQATQASPSTGRGHHSWAEGGRVPFFYGGMAPGKRAGYAFGEEVEQETDFIQGPQGGEEFQETVVEGPEQPSREQLEALAMEIFQLPLEELDEQQLLVVYQEAMQGQPMEEAVQEEDVQFAAQGGLAGLL